MAKLKKTLPKFETPEEEARYWDNHSVLEHFDESDFRPLQARTAKDSPLTIRLDSTSRQALEEIARTHHVGPSTLARSVITSALEQWRRKQHISLTLGDAAEALTRPISCESKEELEKLLSESKAGSLYLLHESQLEKIGKIFIRSLFEAAGFKIEPESVVRNEGKEESRVADK